MNSTILIPILLMLVMMAGGIWVAAAIGLSGMVGLFLLTDFNRMLDATASSLWSAMTSFELLAFPLFLLMGELLYQAGFMEKVYIEVSKWVKWLPGRLIHSNIVASAIFAACSGSSLASASTLGRTSYRVLKEMGYDKKLSIGSIAAGGVLSILIPPSGILIIYGAVAQVSVGQLFLAGIAPGALLVVLFTFYIILVAKIHPERIPFNQENVHLSEQKGFIGQQRNLFLRFWLGVMEFGRSLLAMWQILIVIMVVLGAIYGGIATPTEVGGVGAALAFIFGVIGKKVEFKKLQKSLVNAASMTAAILVIVFSAKLMILTVTYAKLPPFIGRWVEEQGLSPWVFMVFVLVIYLILGMFFDGISILLLTLPFVIPIAQSLGIDMVWFGILVTIAIEFGLLSPPVGFNLFVLRSSTNEGLDVITQGALPFLIPISILLLLVFIFPEIALFISR